jgi:hypothetical protein
MESPKPQPDRLTNFHSQLPEIRHLLAAARTPFPTARVLADRLLIGVALLLPHACNGSGTLMVAKSSARTPC